MLAGWQFAALGAEGASEPVAFVELQPPPSSAAWKLAVLSAAAAADNSSASVAAVPALPAVLLGTGT